MLTQYADVVAVPLYPEPPKGKWQNRFYSWWRLLSDAKPSHVRSHPIHQLAPELKILLETSKYDIVNLELLHSTLLREYLEKLPTILTEHNIEANIQRQLYERSPNLRTRFREWIDWQKLKRYEQSQLRHSSAIVTVKEEDAAICQSLCPGKQVYVVPNGVDCDYFSVLQNGEHRLRKNILFMGTMNYQPNIDGALLFSRAIWPKIRENFPRIEVEFVGANPTPEILHLNDIPGVNVTGFVEDVRSYFWRSAVCIVPLRMGGGTRLKILEAMAAGCPVVSTSIGAEGLDVKDGENILIADTPEDFAKGVIRVLNEPELAKELRRNALCLVKEQYDWAKIVKKLDQAYQSVFQ